MAHPTTYGQLDAATRPAAQTHNPERLSVGASLLVWMVLSGAGWAVFYGIYRLIVS